MAKDTFVRIRRCGALAVLEAKNTGDDLNADDVQSLYYADRRDAFILFAASEDVQSYG